MLFFLGAVASMAQPVIANPPHNSTLFSLIKQKTPSPQINHWIAYVGSGFSSVMLVHPDGSGLKQIAKVNNGLVSGNLKWSPGGKYLAFVQSNKESLDSRKIFLMDAATFNISLLLDNTSGDFDWYQDGEQIIYGQPNKTNPKGFCDGDYISLGGIRSFNILTNEDRQVIPPPVYLFL